MAGVWIATDVLWIVPETILSIRLRSAKDAQKADRGSKSLVIAAVNFGICLGFLAAFEVPSFSLEAHWKAVFALGIAVWLGGILFRLASIRILGHSFTYDVATSKDQQIVERGPYRWLRHPSYLGSLLAMIGFGMTLTNWLAMLLPVCCLATAYAYRIPIEEQALVRGLGSDYSNYMRRTWRLIPFVY
ncbi:MAG: isoprenylcysteine carboxylmethyltransferase family protein [Acidobacteriaceae bacterium]